MSGSAQTLSILKVSTNDTLGGAEKVAAALMATYRATGHQVRLAVGYKKSHDPHVVLVPNDVHRSRWARACATAGNALSPLVGKLRGAARMRQLLQGLGSSKRFQDIINGREDFDFPGTWELLNLAPKPIDILHGHNLHGEYFDLRALPWLSRQVPVVLTLHDAWLLSGHCAHSFGCERWRDGCGYCPDLGIYPAVWRDATAFNWQRKKAIFAQSRFYLATPSHWLMHKVEQSMLRSAAVECRVIPNGVNLSVFFPADTRQARMELGIPFDAKVLLFAANGIRRNMWKDYQTLRSAVGLIAEQLGEKAPLLFLALGEDAQPERIGRAIIRFIPYQDDQAAVARYYQAAHVYIHASRADTFPNTILEAMACGTPVVATAVGGIPEQIDENKTGYLVKAADPDAIASYVRRLLSDDVLRRRMGCEAAESTRRRFSLDRQADAYLKWYREIIDSQKRGQAGNT